MKIPVVCVAELDTSYAGRHQRSLFLQDVSDGSRLISPLEYTMSEEEEKEFSGKVDQKRGELCIVTIDSVFAGRPRVKGQLKFNGAASK